MCNALLELMKDELDEKREEGIKEGESLGVNRINQLILKLSELNRTDDILKAAADREYQKKLLKEFGLLKDSGFDCFSLYHRFSYVPVAQ